MSGCVNACECCEELAAMHEAADGWNKEIQRLKQDQRRLEWLVNEAREYNRDLWLLLYPENWRDAIDDDMKEGEHETNT
jgi:hypothetical protein